ncbi:uncharacterized protein DS421_17g571330 [Arachis hypogaea]|nr:uncharacterized protein DS421_17g571330 [Arachis hypogaea]
MKTKSVQEETWKDRTEEVLKSGRKGTFETVVVSENVCKLGTLVYIDERETVKHHLIHGLAVL